MVALVASIAKQGRGCGRALLWAFVARPKESPRAWGYTRVGATVQVSHCNEPNSRSAYGGTKAAQSFLETSVVGITHTGAAPGNPSPPVTLNVPGGRLSLAACSSDRRLDLKTAGATSRQLAKIACLCSALPPPDVSGDACSLWHTKRVGNPLGSRQHADAAPHRPITPRLSGPARLRDC